jgi:arginyl-tRNA synthetase
MLDDRGNTAVYLLYAYTRIRFFYLLKNFFSLFLKRSIARNAQIDRVSIANYLNKLDNGIIPLEHFREIRLAKQILKFSDCIFNIILNLHINKICDYVYELATLFHDFYKECYVISKTTNEGLNFLKNIFNFQMNQIVQQISILIDLYFVKLLQM